MARIRLKEDYTTEDGVMFLAGYTGTTRSSVNEDGMQFVTMDGHQEAAMDTDKDEVKVFVGWFPVELLEKIDGPSI
jgi:hypothetical protein